jgi:hypothetical protein
MNIADIHNHGYIEAKAMWDKYKQWKQYERKLLLQLEQEQSKKAFNELKQSFMNKC